MHIAQTGLELKILLPCCLPNAGIRDVNHRAQPEIWGKAVLLVKKVEVGETAGCSKCKKV
jgi:hypothetical protein